MNLYWFCFFAVLLVLYYFFISIHWLFQITFNLIKFKIGKVLFNKYLKDNIKAIQFLDKSSEINFFNFDNNVNNHTKLLIEFAFLNTKINCRRRFAISLIVDYYYNFLKKSELMINNEEKKEKSYQDFKREYFID